MLNGVYTIKYQESITRAISDLNKISHATKKAFAISEVEGLMMDEALGDKSVDYSDDTSKTKEYLKKASDAFDSEDSALVEEYCQKIFEVNPENREARVLAAKCYGWDSVQYDLNVESALQHINRAMRICSGDETCSVAAEIYCARKKQISLQLESALMMPSYTGTKRVHKIMMDWEKLLVSIPCLPRDLIENEITLCKNLCLRSKMGIMPGDRLVCTAYATFNNKESYGEHFEKALSFRLEADDGRMSDYGVISEQVQKRLAELKEMSEKGNITLEEEVVLLKKEIALLEKEAEQENTSSGDNLYRSQVSELEKILSGTKPYKVFRKLEIKNQMKTLHKKIQENEKDAERKSSLILAQVDLYKKRIDEIEQD